jgi:hypothetical protein
MIKSTNNIHKVTNIIKRYKNDKNGKKGTKNGYSIKIGIRTETCQK